MPVGDRAGHPPLVVALQDPAIEGIVDVSAIWRCQLVRFTAMSRLKASKAYMRVPSSMMLPLPCWRERVEFPACYPDRRVTGVCRETAVVVQLVMRSRAVCSDLRAAFGGDRCVWPVAQPSRLLSLLLVGVG